MNTPDPDHPTALLISTLVHPDSQTRPDPEALCGGGERRWVADTPSGESEDLDERIWAHPPTRSRQEPRSPGHLGGAMFPLIPRGGNGGSDGLQGRCQASGRGVSGRWKEHCPYSQERLQCGQSTQSLLCNSWERLQCGQSTQSLLCKLSSESKPTRHMKPPCGWCDPYRGPGRCMAGLRPLVH